MDHLSIGKCSSIATETLCKMCHRKEQKAPTMAKHRHSISISSPSRNQKNRDAQSFSSGAKAAPLQEKSNLATIRVKSLLRVSPGRLNIYTLSCSLTPIWRQEVEPGERLLAFPRLESPRS